MKLFLIKYYCLSEFRAINDSELWSSVLLDFDELFTSCSCWFWCRWKEVLTDNISDKRLSVNRNQISEFVINSYKISELITDVNEMIRDWVIHKRTWKRSEQLSVRWRIRSLKWCERKKKNLKKIWASEIKSSENSIKINIISILRFYLFVNSKLMSR
jgi:hypothetical protein